MVLTSCNRLFSIILIGLSMGIPAAAKEGMVFPAGEWQTSTPESQGVAHDNLQKALDDFKSQSGGAGIDEMAIVRNGYLIWQGSGADKVRVLYSCTKTFTSAILGLLAADGVVGIDDFAVKYIPSLSSKYPEYAQIKLSHLASMTSGYDGAKGDGWKFYETDPSRHLECVLEYAVPGPPIFTAGTSFKYHDPPVHLLGRILTKAAGKPLEQLFKERIANPIEMKQFSWSNYGYRDGILFNNPAGTPGEIQGGVSSNALDLSRYGLLFLNQGNWNGKPLLASSFVERAVSTQVGADIPTKYLDLTGRYGFFWWTNGVQKDGKRPWPSAPPKTYAAHGTGRNFIFVIPEWNMVIVRLAPALDGHVQIGNVRESAWENFFSRLKDGVKG
ncbi:MAG: serine hydrolase domain-containing protein [Candidatus Omnitrophota bacterium]